jgi:uncharacterized protein YkwD
MQLRQAKRGVGFIAATLCAAVAAAAVPAAEGATQAEITGQSQLLKEVNRARTSRGLTPLHLNAVLSRPARAHSVYLARERKLDHNGADGKPFYVRIYRAGYSRQKAVGENLGMASGCSTSLSRTMVNMWLKSPGHRRNLLSPRFKNIGIAVVAASDCSNTIYTTDFGG